MTKKIPINLLYDSAYLAAKARMEAQGYRAEEQDQGIIPLLFRKEAEALYLFRPALDGRTHSYRVKITPDAKLCPAVFVANAKPTLYIPQAQYEAPTVGKVRYLWLPRRIEDAPALYQKMGLLTKQDISEFLGVSPISLHYATKAKIGLRVHSRIGVGNTLLFHVDDVLRWNQWRGKGSRPKHCQTRTFAQRLMSVPLLVKRLRVHILRGEVAEEVLRNALPPEIAPGPGLDGLLAAYSQLNKANILDIMQANGLLRDGAAEKQEG